MSTTIEWNGDLHELHGIMLSLSTWGVTTPQPTVFPKIWGMNVLHHHVGGGDDAYISIVEAIYDKNNSMIHFAEKVKGPDSILREISNDQDLGEFYQLCGREFITLVIDALNKSN